MSCSRNIYIQQQTTLTIPVSSPEFSGNANGLRGGNAESVISKRGFVNCRICGGIREGTARRQREIRKSVLSGGPVSKQRLARGSRLRCSDSVRGKNEITSTIKRC